ncbi:MAG: extracellular solute-binding protein [Clostridia bacterium]|nr:extracellular solute-binding protein [Clostridia bacterium]
MAKKLLALVVCLSLCAALVGCNGGVTFNTEDWADMEIRVAGYRNFNDDPLNYEFAEGAKKFTEEYGTTVTFQVGGGDGMGEDLVAGIVAGDPWEIQYCFGISVFPLNFAEGLYTPITEYVDYANNDMIDEVTVEGTRWLGELYGVSSLPMQEVHYIVYNETWMKELGLKTPHEYLAEDNWTMDAYKELNAAATALNAPSRSAFTRPHVGSKYMCSWDLETGECTITYDSPENVEWLSYWASLLTDPQYNIKGSGFVSQRNSIMRDEVMPNLIKDELTQETTDTIRYIHYPNENGELGVYLTDSHFLFPLGVSEEKLPCAFMLACYMTDMKSQLCSENYEANMTAEDWELFQENLEKAYYLPRIFYSGAFAIGNTFRSDIVDKGKAVATHIQENTESLKARALEFNEKYVEGFEAE